MSDIAPILNTFEPISLEKMDAVKLMSRMDTKFIFHARYLSDLLNELSEQYYILDIDGCRNSAYETVYFDTPDYLFYHQHRRGKANRNKVRMRTYLISQQHYFEIKTKSNKGITVKERIKRKHHRTELSEKAETFLFAKTSLHSENIEPKLWVNYSRITLVNKQFPERLTIDTQLIFRNESQHKELNSLVIAELKQERKNKTAFAEIMHKYHIAAVSISKYCFGVIFLNPDIRMNTFKPKLLKLNKTII